MPISGLVITYNEEINIGKCIDALFQVCDEVIILILWIQIIQLKIQNYRSNCYITSISWGWSPTKSWIEFL